MQTRTLNPLEERCIAAYRGAGSIDEACAAAGVHKFLMYKVLKFKGLLRTSDAVQYGTPAARFGASAELEFARLVPAAKSMNERVASNHPGYDFHVDGWRVSVKAFTPLVIKNRLSDRLRWRADLVRHASDRDNVDVFCVFLARDKGGLIQDTIYKTYLVPVELLGAAKSIAKTDGMACALDACEVAPRKLARFLAEGAA